MRNGPVVVIHLMRNGIDRQGHPVRVTACSAEEWEMPARTDYKGVPRMLCEGCRRTVVLAVSK